MHFGAVGWSFLTLFGAVDSPLGSPLRFGVYSIRPPAAFRLSQMEAFVGTRAGAVSAAADDARSLEAALVDGADSESSSMLISTVEGTFSAAPSGRDDLAAAVLRHFSDELGLKLSLERADLVSQALGAAPRVEVLGSIRQPGQVRRVVVAAFESSGSLRHPVVIFSLPSGRYEELKPVIRASLDSLRREGTGPVPLLSQTTLGLGAAFLAVLLLVALRRKKKALQS